MYKSSLVTVVSYSYIPKFRKRQKPTYIYTIYLHPKLEKIEYKQIKSYRKSQMIIIVQTNQSLITTTTPIIITLLANQS